MRDVVASARSQAASLSANGSILLGRSGVANVGSIIPEFKYFATVFRERPVRRAISRIDSLSRNAMRRIMFKSPMWITPLPPVALRSGEGVTWLSSQ